MPSVVFHRTLASSTRSRLCRAITGSACEEGVAIADPFALVVLLFSPFCCLTSAQLRSAGRGALAGVRRVSAVGVNLCGTMLITRDYPSSRAGRATTALCVPSTQPLCIAYVGALCRRVPFVPPGEVCAHY